MHPLAPTPRKHVSLWKSLRNVMAMNRDPIAFLQALAEEHPYEPLIPFARIRGTEALIARDAEVAQTILNSRSFGLAALLMKTLAKQFGAKGPFTTKGPEWERQRAMLAPLFKKDEALRGPKAEFVRTEIHGLIQELERAATHGTPVDILTLAQNTTIAIACKIIIGAHLSPRETNECRNHLEGMVASTFEAMNNPLLFLSPWYRARTRRTMKRLHSLIHRIMNDEAPAVGFTTALGILKKARLAAHIDDEFFFSCLIQLITASHETTASAIAWLCRHLSEHPEIVKETQVRSEALVLSNTRPASDLSLHDFPRLTGIVSEVLMRRPPIISVFRSAATDVDIMLRDCTFTKIPKGTLVYIPLFLINQEQLQASGTAPPTPFSSTVFGKGVRTCPGGPLATRILLTFLALAINRGFTFTITRENGHNAHLAYKPRGLSLAVSLS